jgi:hypothetical protein
MTNLPTYLKIAITPSAVGLQGFSYGYGATFANLIFNLIFLQKQPQ